MIIAMERKDEIEVESIWFVSLLLLARVKLLINLRHRFVYCRLATNNQCARDAKEYVRLIENREWLFKNYNKEFDIPSGHEDCVKQYNFRIFEIQKHLILDVLNLAEESALKFVEDSVRNGWHIPTG